MRHDEYPVYHYSWMASGRRYEAFDKGFKMDGLTEIYNAFDAEEPLAADDITRYVDLSAARGNMRIASRLVQRVVNAGRKPSHHLLTGNTKCGKTTELNRTVRALEQQGYATVFFDAADDASTYAFEYTTLLLLLTSQVIAQLAARTPAIRVGGQSAQKLADFLVEKEVTLGGNYSGDASVKMESEFAPGFLAQLLGKFGLSAELRGGFERSRQITYKVEEDAPAFLDGIQQVVGDARKRVIDAGYKDLVIVCDGCDKLRLTATDQTGSRDLHLSMFVEHRSDLCSVPCHVIYTVPLSIQANLGAEWGRGPEFVPAIPVNELSNVDSGYVEEGRRALREVADRRLTPYGLDISTLFQDDAEFERIISVSGGQISDMLLLVREAILSAQLERRTRLLNYDVDQAVLTRAIEYSSLIQSDHLAVLSEIAQAQTRPANNEAYRQIVSRRLALEYLCGDEIRVDLHPLVGASDAYRRWRAT